VPFPTDECKKLKDFVAMAKHHGVPLVPVLVKRMLDKGMLLFGFINLLGDNGEKQVEELTAAQNKRVNFASDKYVSFLSLVLM
jgi:snRNA-activating protein complex subunit 1